MSEQFWYTWSTAGFGITSAGFRVRAASNGFMNARGLVDMQSERLLTLRQHLNYDLPQDTLDPYKIDVRQAPRSLAFVQAGSERILVNTTYTGLDVVKRAGNFFSHLLTELPPVPSPCPGGQLPFSAREAITLWLSDFWKDSEGSLDPGRLDLPPVSPTDLVVGPLSVRDAARVPDLLRYVIEAFLMLEEQQRLYIAAPAETVAAVIWGLTQSLPRTLTVLRNLTFNTYVRDADKASAVIVGTCWFSPLAHGGHGDPERDLPAVYYQAQNPYGFAINGYQPERRTPLEPEPLVSKFAQYAVDCLVHNNLAELGTLCDGAEKRNITGVAEFLQHYVSFQETLSEEEVTHLLITLTTKARELITRAVQCLAEGKDLAVAAGLVREQGIQLEAEGLKRGNVRRSIIRLLMKDQLWWKGQGKTMLDTLRRLSDGYNQNSLAALDTDFLERIKTSREWKKDQGQEAIKPIRPLLQSAADTNPATLLEDLVIRVVNVVWVTQNELADALVLLATDIAGRVCQALQTDDLSQASFFTEVLTISTPPSTREAEVWVSLLQQVAGPTISTSVFRQWWQRYGREKIGSFRVFTDQYHHSKLISMLTSFSERVMPQLQAAIMAGDTDALHFWEGVFITAAPSASQPSMWLSLLRSLRGVMATPAYRGWWEEQGEGVALQLRRLAEKEPQGELARNLSTFAREVADDLYKQIMDQAFTAQPGEHIAFFLKVLTATTPPGETSAWTSLLQQLEAKLRSRGRVYDLFGWELHSLLLQTWGSIAALEEHESMYRHWLEVRWSELDQLLSLRLPASWQKVALTRVLTTKPDIPLPTVIDIVKLNAALFEEVLQALMKVPAGQQDVYATREDALDFFSILAEQRYPRRIQLLDGMLAANGYQKEMAETLLRSAQLEEADEGTLLENYCKQLLAEQELPPSWEALIQRYLYRFKASDLNHPPARELLQRLQKRNETPALRLPHSMRAGIALWCKIAEFIDQPVVSKQSLRDLRHAIRDIHNIPDLAADTREKLAAILVPRLVEFVTSEINLGRVIDDLGRVLAGAGTGAIGPDLLLLEQMAAVAGEKYGQERPPKRIAPYVKVILGEAPSLPSPEKEQFIDRCLQALLQDMDPKVRDQLKTDALWPDELMAEWKGYASRSGTATVRAALAHFREVLQRREMFAIVTAYQPTLEGHLKTDEQRLLALAFKFVEAYRANDDAALVAANKAIMGSPYTSLLGYTDEQRKRVSLALTRVESVPKPSAPAPATNARPPAAPQSAPPSTPTVNERYVAVVKGQGITPGWFEWVLVLKQPYTRYRISYLRQDIQQLQQDIPYIPKSEPQRKQALQSKKKYREQELQALAKLRSEQQWRQAVLDELVDDVLIQEEIAQVTRQDVDAHARLDPVPDLPKILAYLRNHLGNLYAPLRFDDNPIKEDIEKALSIFRRRELFAWYLHTQEQLSLSNWLKKRRDSEKATIAIYYERAGVDPPRGSFGSSIWPL